MKKYISPELEMLMLESPNVMLEMSDENSLFVDVLEQE
jgi:hypothetical protein